MASTPQRDYYGILGLAPTANDDEIRHAYRRLAKMWHPDRYRTAPDHLRQQAERRIRLLTEAHATLADPTRRATYDRDYFKAHPDVHHPAVHDGVAPDAAPIPMPNAMHIPGYQPSMNVHATTSDPNGMGIFFGLILSMLALTLVGIALRNPNSLISGGGVAIACVMGIVAVLSFAGAGPLIAIATSGNPHGPHYYPNKAAAPDDLSYFEDLVQQAADDIPEEFAAQIENLVIFVEPEPSMTLLRRVGVKPGWTLLGLYEGVPLTHQSTFHQGLPEKITLFQGPIERHCLFSAQRIEHQVRATLLHELAHHFGMDHDEMPIWVKA